MLKRCLSLIPLFLLSTAFCGCLGPKGSGYVADRRISLAEDSDGADQFWEAVQETLRRHRFRLDRIDRRAGLITTLPEISQHLFEFWRHDVDAREDFWEATINPIRRWVEVTVSPGADDAWERVAVVVHKERLSSPDRQFNSTGAAYQYFGDSLPSTTGLVRVTAEHDRWLDLGRDPAMEDLLLRDVLERAGLADMHGDSPRDDQ